MKIPFNKPFLTGKETQYIKQVVKEGKISGDGSFTKKCHQFLEHRYGFKKCLLTTSCTDALEMCAILLNIQPGDEVIIPSYTFVSTANAFVLRGAKIVFADSGSENPNIDPAKIEQLISPKTKAIVVVHYAGIACDMDRIMSIAQKHKLVVVEDAAQAIDSFYHGKPLGSIGQLAAFSFHETKNVISGEGGALAINDESYTKRAEIIREKGTNRSAFFRGEVDKYNWVDIGSSFLPSEIIAAFLFAQLENIEMIQTKRKKLWNIYHDLFQPLPKKGVQLPHIPAYASLNAHMYYLVCADIDERDALIKHLKDNGIYAVFHYLSLHKSPFYTQHYNAGPLPESDRYTDCLVRLPLYYELKEQQTKFIANKVLEFYGQ
ncbi:MAG: dTDP-4-amino-4,6-dideoxygalactose transaminase [Chitinophagales bacterium]|nr:dTDP-4-amino-4,6-dideoxygalactose transaminase [Chitinophagales bacterium]